MVGTGGGNLYMMGKAKPNSEVRNAGTAGVLVLNLHDASYDWRFIPQPGKTFKDSGHGSCH